MSAIERNQVCGRVQWQAGDAWDPPLCSPSGAQLLRSAGVVASAKAPMSDLIFISITLAFFLVSALYVRLCGKL